MCTPATRHPSLLLPVWLVFACSSVGTPSRADGTVVVFPTLPDGAKVSAATYLVARRDGETERLGSWVNGLSPLALTLAVAPDYVISINALAREQDAGASGECEGFHKFDVFEDETVQVTVPLECSDLWQPATRSDAAHDLKCWFEAVVAAPSDQTVNGPIYVSATFLPETAHVEWTVQDEEVGRFRPPTSSAAEGAFVCTSSGTTRLTVAISEGSCHAETSVEVSCHSGDDAGPLKLLERESGGARPRAAIR